MLIGSSRRGRRRGLLLVHCTPPAFSLSLFLLRTRPLTRRSKLNEFGLFLILTDFREQISKGGQGSGARGSGRGGGGVLRRCTLRGRCRRLAGLHVFDLVFLLLAAVTAAFSVWKRRKNAKTSVLAAAFTNQETKNNPVLCSRRPTRQQKPFLFYLVVWLGGAATSPLVYVQGDNGGLALLLV